MPAASAGVDGNSEQGPAPGGSNAEATADTPGQPSSLVEESRQ